MPRFTFRPTGFAGYFALAVLINRLKRALNKEPHMESEPLNIWAVIAAAVSAFVIGGLWYSPLVFARHWMAEIGMSEEQMQRGNMVKIFGLAFLFILIIAINLGMFLNQPTVDVAAGAFYGFLTGFGWVAMAVAVNSLYEQRSWRYMLIVGGYWTVAFTVMGVILGAWK